MIYAKDRPTHSVGRPITFDAVACDFPELKLIGMHVGIPWTDEMIAKAWKPLRDSAVQLFKLRI
jgi:predicted TIM-barrel fold metal-dependent hydrolase